MIFFFTDTATTEIYTLSLHDALPISTDDDGDGRLARRRRVRRRVRPARCHSRRGRPRRGAQRAHRQGRAPGPERDRKSTRLNSSHMSISYAVFCLKKKKKTHPNETYL